MTPTTTIHCPQCGDDIVIPTPDDLTLIGDLIEAHGATHGLDWRGLATQWVTGVMYLQEADGLRNQLENNE